MSITDQPPPSTPPEQPAKRKPGRPPRKPLVPMYADRPPPPQRKPAVVVKEPEPRPPAGEFAGMTGMGDGNACCDECFVLRCVISGAAYCAHPYKGGLQASSMGNDAVKKRYARAITYLKRGVI